MYIQINKIDNTRKINWVIEFSLQGTAYKIEYLKFITVDDVEYECVTQLLPVTFESTYSPDEVAECALNSFLANPIDIARTNSKIIELANICKLSRDETSLSNWEITILSRVLNFATSRCSVERYEDFVFVDTIHSIKQCSSPSVFNNINVSQICNYLDPRHIVYMQPSTIINSFLSTVYNSLLDPSNAQ